MYEPAEGIPAFMCVDCKFINFDFCHCPRCDSYILINVIVLKPQGFNQSQKHNESIKQTDLFPLHP